MSGIVSTADRNEPDVADAERDEGRSALTWLQRAKVACDLAKMRVKEYLEFDSAVFRTAAGVTGLAAGLGLYAAGYTRRGFDLLSKLHRSACPDWVARRVERLVRDAAGPSQPDTHPLRRVYQEYVAGQAPNTATEKFFRDPARAVGKLVLALKSPKANERGVLLVKYSYMFPLFAKLFDVEQIAKRYYLVLEPSWSGYCNTDILSYARYPFPVFVQSYEPRDAAFIKSTCSNLIAVDVAANWWVDHRLFAHRPATEKDFDVVMIASWARFKRHHRFFAALRAARESGRVLRVALLGYPAGVSREYIMRLARYYGIADQLEVREWITPGEVGEYLSRAKVNILWSRREGVNKAIVEGMFAGVPCIVRAGLNYGFSYPYINDKTGRVSTEAALPERLLWMIDHHHEFNPRDWVMQYMSCQTAAKVLGDAIRNKALERGETWSEELAVKVNYLHDIGYWDKSDYDRFESDHSFIRSAVRDRS